MSKWWTAVLIVALLLLLFIAVPINYTKGNKETLIYRPMFESYIEKFNKTYKGNAAEYETRFRHFLASVEEIDALNAASHGPEYMKARYGLTKLSDMSKAEYRDIHLSDEKQVKPPEWYGKTWEDFRDSSRHRHNHSYEVVHSGDNIIVNINVLKQREKRAVLPLAVDWRTKGVIGPVRDQGLCGACWAFSTVGTMEAMSAMQTGKLETLSVQEVIDCAGLGNSGCAGGDICLLLDWLLLSGSALQTETEYPLNLKQNVCQLKKAATGVKISSFTCDSMVGKEDQILEAIATHGPVAVAVNALTWQNYLGGVIQYHCSGTPADLNHAVELIGYDLTKEIPYYIAKNSWGSEFGNGGYIHLAIGSNICGLANEVASIDVK